MYKITALFNPPSSIHCGSWCPPLVDVDDCTVIEYVLEAASHASSSGCNWWWILFVCRSLTLSAELIWISIAVYLRGTRTNAMLIISRVRGSAERRRSSSRFPIVDWRAAVYFIAKPRDWSFFPDAAHLSCFSSSSTHFECIIHRMDGWLPGSCWCNMEEWSCWIIIIQNW